MVMLQDRRGMCIAVGGSRGNAAMHSNAMVEEGCVLQWKAIVTTRRGNGCYNRSTAMAEGRSRVAKLASRLWL
ncbi:hypothetical protein B296_00049016 [Ensete ventricosum]|uniref:Uncharacterized protein n=1 Tax=Ensete ventricosum TaxID=4639 RepID=A0A426YQ91_ENSVE|nr:hypothetical protein B296_00049016 [Ensete ventricosum]